MNPGQKENSVRLLRTWLPKALTSIISGLVVEAVKGWLSKQRVSPFGVQRQLLPYEDLMSILVWILIIVLPAILMVQALRRHNKTDFKTIPKHAS